MVNGLRGAEVTHMLLVTWLVSLREEQHISRGRLNVLCNAANYSEIENNDGQLLLGFSIRSNLWIMPGHFKGGTCQETRQTVADELSFCPV